MIYQVTVNNARLEIPKDEVRCPPELQALIASCWNDQPSARPSAAEVQISLEGMLT